MIFNLSKIKIENYCAFGKGNEKSQRNEEKLN